jgi:uncharacterized phage infection (PIP) family protein YhgE
MKRKLLVIALLAAFVPPPAPLRAQQDSPTAAAEREQTEERHRTLTKRLDGIEESIAAFQKNVTALRDEVRRLKDELDRSKNKNESAATQESIKYLAEKIEEVDKKRLNDSELVRKKFDELRKFVLENPGGPRMNPSPPADGNPSRTNRVGTPRVNSGGTPRANPGSSPRADTGGSPRAETDGNQTGWKYKIKANDTLAGIIAALKRERGIILTQKQMEQANEGVNWNKLKIGQEIFIPAP